MKKLFLSLLFVFWVISCATIPMQIAKPECDRMLWRPDLNHTVQMFCLGEKICDKDSTQCTKLIAEAYHPVDKGILYTLWDNDSDCVADTNVVYYGEKGVDGKYTYAVSYIQSAVIGLTEIRNSEEQHGIKVLREIDCPKK